MFRFTLRVSASEPSSDTLKPVILIAESCQSRVRRSGYLGNSGFREAFDTFIDLPKGCRIIVSMTTLYNVFNTSSHDSREPRALEWFLLKPEADFQG